MKAVILPLFFYIVVLLTACVYHDIEPPKRLQQYHISYMFYKDGILHPYSDNMVTLQLNDLRQVIKRTGGFAQVPGYVGLYFIFSKDVYEEITYRRDAVTIDRKFSRAGFYDPYKKEIFFSDNKISRIVVLNDQLRSIMYPYYNSSGLIYKTVETRWRIRTQGDTLYIGTTVKDFFYEGGNLVRVQGEDIGPFNSISTTTETFEDYDTAPNPTKPLIIFDEIFYRSLSANNFRKYSIEKRGSSGYNSSSATLSWQLRYDNSGVPLYY
jgi:hypothetical protein